MFKVIAVALAVCSFSVIQPAFAQQANPTQIAVSGAQAQVPIFRIAVIGRTTPAVNYRPRHGDTRIDFVGTPLMPKAKGNATVSGEKGVIKIDARFERLEPASKFGPEYLTYVLWAITPEGRATNLGEVQADKNDNDNKINVTTELQAFGMIVTAEPYFAVTQPSDAVVMENLLRDGTTGTAEAIVAKYELLKRGTYLMNNDIALYKVKPLEPGSPLDLAQARNAVALARFAGSAKYSTDTLAKAEKLLATAEIARENKKTGNEVQMPARQAVQTAEDARLISLKKQEDEFIAMDKARASQVAGANARADEQRKSEAELSAQAEINRLREAALKAQADQAAAASAAVADRERAAAELARLSADREKANADAARLQAEAADAARRQAEAATAQAQNQMAQSERERDELRARMRTQLNAVLETRETARGLIINLSDVLFDTGSAGLKPGAREKLARVSGILAAHPGLKVAVEGHTDNVGSDSSNQRLSEQRASSVHTYLVAQGLAREAVGTAGLGEGQPVATNDTAAGRQQNRRVELVVTGEAIGRK